MSATGKVQGVCEVHASCSEGQPGGDALRLLRVYMSEPEQVLEDANDLG